MDNNQNLDDRISRLVRSIDLEIPPKIESRIHGLAATLLPHRRIKILRPLWFAASAGIAALLLVVLLLSPIFRSRTEPKIAEIRTEFDLPDKNIKIIFIQKPDFPLLKEKSQ
jgi:type VI protein secretion system component VasF